jgi:hypothetical protein
LHAAVPQALAGANTSTSQLHQGRWVLPLAIMQERATIFTSLTLSTLFAGLMRTTLRACSISGQTAPK